MILPMPVLMFKMSLPKMIILFDDYNGRHYPVEVKIIQLPKKTGWRTDQPTVNENIDKCAFLVETWQAEKNSMHTPDDAGGKTDLICSRLITSLY